MEKPGAWVVSRALRNLPTFVLALIVPVIVVITVVITLNTTSSTSAGTATGISIRNFAFSPATFSAKAGSTITVTNGDDTTHTLTADGHSFDTGNLSGGAHATIKVGAPGTYTYHCQIHNYMTGKIKVT